MEHKTHNEESYTQKQLTELLNLASENLIPSKGYSLRLEGVRSSASQHAGLEVFFGTYLDDEAGANLTLGYDETSNQLLLRELSYPMKDISGFVKLIHTETISYIPVIEIRNQLLKTPEEYLSHEDGNNLLVGFGIEDIPTSDKSTYAYWRSKVLSKTRGWHLKEELEIPLGLTLDSAQSVIIQNEEALNLKNKKMLQKKSFTRSIVLFDEESNATSHTEQTIESFLDKNEHTMPMYTRTYNKSRDPFVLNSEQIDTPTLKALPLDHNSYHDFKNALEEAVATRQSEG